MFTSTTLIRFRRLLIVGAVVAGAVVPAASAVGRPPDVQDTASANVAAQLSRPPDVRDAAGGATIAIPDAIDRYVATHALDTATLVSRPPDIRDTAVQLAGQGQFFHGTAPSLRDEAAMFHRYSNSVSNPGSSTVVSRPPDISDTALAVQYGSVTQPSSGFNWGDWAIGIGSGMGLALLLGAGALVSRQLRHRVQTA
jgi:hypothetical protein